MKLTNWTTGEVAEPDTICPKCGKPWKEGYDYGHAICCGCSTCGWSDTVIDIEYHQVDEESFIPIVNIGGSIRGKHRTRPTEMYIRVTKEVLSGVLSTEEKRQKLLKWLSNAILPSFKEEIK